MIDVILSTPPGPGFMTDAASWATDRSPVQEGELTSVFDWGGRCDIATSYRGPYRTVDATYDGNGDVVTPASFTTRIYTYLKVTQECFDGLLAKANPTGTMPGGTRIEYASGVEDLVRDPSDPDYGTYGALPSNGLQHGWL